MSETDQRPGLFIDLDGTLADSLRIMRVVYAHFLDIFGHTGTDAEFETLNGPPLRIIVGTLKRTYKLAPSIMDLLDLYRRELDAMYFEVPPNPGAERLLAAAAMRDWPVAVVTSSNSLNTQRWLNANGLADYVTAVIGGDATSRGKPHPDPYLAALALTGCTGDVSVAVEDAPQGAAAAISAGIVNTYVLNKPTAFGGDWPAAAGFVDSLGELAEKLFHA